MQQERLEETLATLAAEGIVLVGAVANDEAGVSALAAGLRGPARNRIEPADEPRVVGFIRQQDADVLD